MALPAQKVSCTLAQKSEGEPYTISVSIAPKVTFENGKAVSARLNWGEANSPMLAYALIYAGTGFDNSTNVLGPEAGAHGEQFTGKKCKRVKVICRATLGTNRSDLICGWPAARRHPTAGGDTSMITPHPISSPLAAC